MNPALGPREELPDGNVGPRFGSRRLFCLGDDGNSFTPRPRGRVMPRLKSLNKKALSRPILGEVLKLNLEVRELILTK